MLYKEIEPDFAKIRIVKGNADEEANGVLEGYASVFGNKDLGGEIVEPGAFAKTIKDRIPRGDVKLMDSHLIFEGTQAVIGVTKDAEEDKIGLKFRAVFSSVQRAQDVRIKVNEGVLNALSFGYDVIKAKDDENGKGRLLQELKLYEISVVAWGMNPKARITDVKSERGAGVITVGDYTVAPLQYAWALGDAIRRFRAKVSDKDPATWGADEFGAYKAGFLWYDAQDPLSFSSYHFPVVDVVDGETKLCFQALTAALKAIRGEGTMPWQLDAGKLEQTLRGLYKKFEQQFPEKGEDVVVPGNADNLVKSIADYRKQIQFDTLIRNLRNFA